MPKPLPFERSSLCDRPSFFEAEITQPAIHGLTDDHVIQELDLENPGAFANPSGEA